MITHGHEWTCVIQTANFERGWRGPPHLLAVTQQQLLRNDPGAAAAAAAAAAAVIGFC